MTRRKRVTKETIAGEKEPAKTATKLVPNEPEFNLESLVALVCAYTKYDKAQARNLITGVVSATSQSLIGDVIDWCVHVKEHESNGLLINEVAKGSAFVKRLDDGWITLQNGITTI
jgi:hypothetical protein